MKYEEYLNKANDTLTLEAADRIHSSIQSSIEPTDEDAVELYNDFLDGAFAYATVRSGWLLLSKEQKMD